MCLAAPAPRAWGCRGGSLLCCARRPPRPPARGSAERRQQQGGAAAGAKGGGTQSRLLPCSWPAGRPPYLVGCHRLPVEVGALQAVLRPQLGRVLGLPRQHAVHMQRLQRVQLPVDVCAAAAARAQGSVRLDLGQRRTGAGRMRCCRVLRGWAGGAPEGERCAVCVCVPAAEACPPASSSPFTRRTTCCLESPCTRSPGPTRGGVGAGRREGGGREAALAARARSAPPHTARQEHPASPSASRMPGTPP